ncbi:MAG: DNA/RNA helicase domain-containing protein, partial [Bryobacteraceae bacterium]
DGLGIMLNASAGDEIAYWYLNPQGDIRSSYALEVPANEYTCQGLELDFACICWGGDLLWSEVSQAWAISRLSGPAWQQVRNQDARRFAMNSYRVLMTRAREGLVLWIPEGDESDSTRSPGALNATAIYLMHCGAVSISGIPTVIV